MTAWKDLERRICRDFGGRRGGPLGASISDCVGVPFAIECKRTTRYQLRGAWIEQARRQSVREGNPWLLVIAEHNDRRPIAVLDYVVCRELAQAAGRIPAPLEVADA